MFSGKWRLLAVHQADHLLRIAQPGSGTDRESLIDSAEITCCETHVERADILFQIFPPLGAGDRHNVFALSQHPGQRQLCRFAFLFGCNFFDAADQIKIFLKILALEARRKAAIVVGGKIIESFELPGEETPAQRAVGNESDAQFAAGGENFVSRDRASTGNIRFAKLRWDEL